MKQLASYECGDSTIQIRRILKGIAKDLANTTTHQYDFMDLVMLKSKIKQALISLHNSNVNHVKEIVRDIIDHLGNL